jgi:hypothetical protein
MPKYARQQQEEWEIENLGIVDEDLVTRNISERFEEAVPGIERSAHRNVGST